MTDRWQGYCGRGWLMFAWLQAALTPEHVVAIEETDAIEDGSLILVNLDKPPKFDVPFDIDVDLDGLPVLPGDTIITTTTI